MAVEVEVVGLTIPLQPILAPVKEGLVVVLMVALLLEMLHPTLTEFPVPVVAVVAVELNTQWVDEELVLVAPA